jgi:hypothetical protein
MTADNDVRVLYVYCTVNKPQRVAAAYYKVTNLTDRPCLLAPDWLRTDGRDTVCVYCRATEGALPTNLSTGRQPSYRLAEDSVSEPYKGMAPLPSFVVSDKVTV